jgi:predicted amidohydrolase
MKITIYQFATAWLDPKRNLDLIETVCKQINGQSDILILPEMFATGYIMDTRQLNPVWEQYTIDRLQLMAQKYALHIGGSVPTTKNGSNFNTFVMVSDQGLMFTYNKIHLFTPAGEKDAYAAGNTTSSCNINNWKIQSLICYDLRFPYLAYGTEKADIIIYAANWPKARISHWIALLRARAIENQCYVIGVNRTGRDENGYDYNGHSACFDFNGDEVVILDDLESFYTVTLDKSKLIAYREKLPFLDDIKSDLL